jgi:hypothetical protein
MDMTTISNDQSWPELISHGKQRRLYWLGLSSFWPLRYMAPEEVIANSRRMPGWQKNKPYSLKCLHQQAQAYQASSWISRRWQDLIYGRGQLNGLLAYAQARATSHKLSSGATAMQQSPIIPSKEEAMRCQQMLQTYYHELAVEWQVIDASMHLDTQAKAEKRGDILEQANIKWLGAAKPFLNTRYWPTFKLFNVTAIDSYLRSFDKRALRQAKNELSDLNRRYALPQNPIDDEAVLARKAEAKQAYFKLMRYYQPEAWTRSSQRAVMSFIQKLAAIHQHGVETFAAYLTKEVVLQESDAITPVQPLASQNGLMALWEQDKQTLANYAERQNDLFLKEPAKRRELADVIEQRLKQYEREFATRYHPDRQPDSLKDTATTIFQEVKPLIQHYHGQLVSLSRLYSYTPMYDTRSYSSSTYQDIFAEMERKRQQENDEIERQIIKLQKETEALDKAKGEWKKQKEERKKQKVERKKQKEESKKLLEENKKLLGKVKELLKKTEKPVKGSTKQCDEWLALHKLTEFNSSNEAKYGFQEKINNENNKTIKENQEIIRELARRYNLLPDSASQPPTEDVNDEYKPTGPSF